MQDDALGTTCAAHACRIADHVQNSTKNDAETFLANKMSAQP